VANGVVYIGSGDDNLYALSATTGDELWSFASGFTSSAAVANGVVYVGSGNDNIYALNATTGTELWSFSTGGEVFSSSPAVANGVVYVGSDPGSVYAFSEKGGLASGSEQRPDPRTLRPDLSLKVSKPVANVANNAYTE
jgi:outer membrane protein assembly factor BamB